MNDKILNMIGLCNKAGKLSAGSFLAEEAIKKGKSRLLIISRQASENTKKQLINLCNNYNIKYIEYGDNLSLAKFVKKQNTVAVSINDSNFKKAILDLFGTTNYGGVEND